MNNKISRSVARLLCLTTCVGAITAPLAACSGKEKALILATDALDSVFNPFFYTSGADGEIVGQTQIGMLHGDPQTGLPSAGWDEPCVAFEYSVVKTGSKENMKNPTDYSNYYTDYYFAIKDNIKFSDGEALTKDDVLFNIYMYLDPVYTGSNTMYSVKIQGLTEYRTQTKDLNEAGDADMSFQQVASGRRSKIIQWKEATGKTWADLSAYEFYGTNDKTIETDIEKIQAFYRQSLEETWTSAISSDVKKEYEKYKGNDGKLLITEPWELFLFYYGVFELKEKYGSGSNAKIEYYEFDKSSLPNYIKVPSTEAARKSDEFKKVLIDYIYDGKFKEQKSSDADAAKSYKATLVNIMNTYPVSSYFNDYLVADVKYRRFKDNMAVKSVEGIKIEKMSAIPQQDGSDKALKDGEGNSKQFDVLHIRINGVDPKAIQNFSFTVAPGHYYSDPETWKKAVDDADDDEFFGVKYSDPEFMNMVRLKQLPLGAGPFVAAKASGGVATEKSQFFGSDNLVKFESNKFFLLGEPKIKKLRYKVINNSKLYESVKLKEVHYASPSMKREDINKLTGNDSNIVNSASADNLGYGYIGVSARYIPNIYIRKAIMSTFDPTKIEAYYGSGGASVIYRPMSKTLKPYYQDSWTAYYPYTDKENAKAIARQYLLDGGCQYNEKTNSWIDEKGKKLKYTFTVAGDSDDHPAYQILLNSSEILNDLGLEVSLTHDSTALSRLASGLLTVWAAAWSSSSDPDMYQVYHQKSQATSITAWGYRYILSSEFEELKASNNPRNFPNQRKIISDLSDLIDDGRETDDVETRVNIYSQAMDMLMNLAVEFPTYQRKVYYVWAKGVFNESTLITGNNVTTYQSPLSRIWEVELA